MLLLNFFSQPLIGVAFILALLIVLTFHEFFHALVAVWQGDNTAKDAGRLTLNPLAHLDLTGTILLLLIGFGWGKPVPVNYYNLKNQKWGPAIVSAAGPFANLIMAIIFSVVFKLIAPSNLNPVAVLSGASGNLLLIFLSFLIIYSLILMVFNLIPIPPLDGSKIFFAFLPPKYDYIQAYLEKNGPLILLILIIADNFLGIGIISAFFNLIINLFLRLYSIL
ncbi:MAG: site-2 protease family protein [Patescibacteria group bacterium]